jgi:hypothetical protein
LGFTSLPRSPQRNYRVPNNDIELPTRILWTQYLKNCAISALAVVSECSGPTFLITATTNPYWPEIQEMLLYSQSPYDRPDIVCRVFHRRIELLLSNLRKKKYFGSSEVVYLMRASIWISI